MLFSVVIPTYNRANIIGETIQSVMNQQFTDFELLIIDDGSTDNTREVVEEYVALFPSKIRYLYQKNNERAAARNNGIKASLGDFIVLLDSDDELMPFHLELLSVYIQKYTDCNFFSTHYCFSEHGKTFNSPVSSLKEGLYDYKLFLKGNPLACNVCLRRENPKLILFNENRTLAVMEDWIFFLQNLQHDSLYLIQTVSVKMREHEGRSMSQNKLVIQRKLLAFQFLKKELHLTEKELTLLESNADFFCSIHSYLDDDKFQSRNFLRKSIRKSGPNLKTFLLSIKLIAGRNISQFLSRLTK
jgi:glycosyltransferase involved in cell wall biosynthesis